MSERTLTTLDFVISVLREHEKDLTILSDKLEDVLNSVSGKGMKKDVGKIQSALKEIKKKIHVLDQKVTAMNNSSVETLLNQLLNQVSIQNKNLSLLIEAMKGYPTKKEMENLKTSIASVNSLVGKLVSKEE